MRGSIKVIFIEHCQGEDTWKYVIMSVIISDSFMRYMCVCCVYICINVFVISGESHFCSSQYKPCVNPARPLLHCICWVHNPASFSPHSPVPTITWRKINGNIPKKARLRKSQAVLEIPNIQLEDSGTYECKAENPRGGTAFKGHLQVYSESEACSHSLFMCCWGIVFKE